MQEKLVGKKARNANHVKKLSLNHTTEEQLILQYCRQFSPGMKKNTETPYRCREICGKRGWANKTVMQQTKEVIEE